MARGSHGTRGKTLGSRNWTGQRGESLPLLRGACQGSTFPLTSDADEEFQTGPDDDLNLNKPTKADAT